MDKSAPFPSLPPEIMLHIFHKLPIISVYKCKLVCKEWFSLISDPFFKSTYNTSSIPNHPVNIIMIPKRKKNLSLLAYGEINSTKSTPRVARPQPLPLTFASSHRDKILGSCNGLVALYRHPGSFFLLNPYLSRQDQIIVHVQMYEYILNSYVLCGLCYDNVNNEYKAVFSVLRPSYDERRFCVVNFKKRSWKLKTQPQMQNLETWRDMGNCGTIIRNVTYWVCRDIAFDEYLIIYLDSKTEEFKKGPRVPNGKEIRGLGTLDGKLTASLKSDLGLEVWALKEHGNGDCCWSMLFVTTYKFRYLSTLTWMVKEGEVLIDANAILLVYNVTNGSLRELQKTERRFRRSLYNILVYFPSFISPI